MHHASLMWLGMSTSLCLASDGFIGRKVTRQPVTSTSRAPRLCDPEVPLALRKG